MKKALVLLSVVALVAMVSTSAFAERWGKPGANLAKGQTSVGLEYSYIEHTVDFKAPSFVFVGPLTAPINGEHQEQENQLLVRLGYGLTDQLEAFIKMGGISTNVQDMFLNAFTQMENDLEGSLEFAVIGGLSATLLQSGDFRLGLQGQIGFHQIDDTDESDVPWIQSLHSDVLTVEGALLASYTLGKFTPYGGLCMWLRESNARYQRYTIGLAPAQLLDITTDQEEWLGGVVGVNYAVTDNVRLGVEMTGVGEGLGVSVGVNVAL
jgi:hypothetical protein